MEVCDHLGHTADGLQALDEAYALVEQHEERFWEAEVCRLRGVLLLRQPGTPQAEAEACFQQALDVARRQEAKSLELRAALSLSRLWQQQGKRAEARELLAPVYGWFTEGFDTADLQRRQGVARGTRGRGTMTFDDLLAHVLEILQRQGRVSYGALKRRFALDDAYLADLKTEIIEAQRLAVDEEGRILVWTGTAAVPFAPVPTPQSAAAPAPLTYTPSYLAEKILTSRSALEGERKQVTVLFADLTGNTELIRDLDPEAGQALLDPASQRMMDAVHRFEGTVNDVAGDGLMAMFGAPIAHEDHALRACYAALAMQAAMRRYADEVRRTRGLEMLLRVGLHSGDVVVRTISNDLYMNYSGVGVTTNLAARMEQLAPPGTIRVTAATLHLVEGAVQVHALGLDPGQGAGRARRCLRVGRGHPRPSPLAGGRGAWADALCRARAGAGGADARRWQQAGRGQGQLVALLGEAGVGKSRLVYEFVHCHAHRGLARAGERLGVLRSRPHRTSRCWTC